MLIALLKVGRLEMKFRKMNLAALLLVVGLSAGTLSGCGKEAPAAAAADIAREAGSQAEDKQTEDRQTEDGQTEDGQTGRPGRARPGRRHRKPGDRQPDGCSARRNGTGSGRCNKRWGLWD